MLPRVIMHNMVSLDGRVEGFVPDMGLHYETAGHWKIDAHLVGSNTLLAAPAEIADETPEDRRARAADPNDLRPLLVVPDSRGRIRTWHHWRKQPYWRDAVVLCSQSTPPDYISYLRERKIEHIVAGGDKVDLRAALSQLRQRYGVTLVLTDSGGSLNGALLRAGLVHEVSVLVMPCLVGGDTPSSIFRAPPIPDDSPIALKLSHVEQLRDGIVWLRYAASPPRTR